MSLTRRQRELLDFINRFITEKGYCPSFQEMAAGLGLRSISNIHKHLENLQRKGLIQKRWNRGRSIEINTGLPSVAAVQAPLKGLISAGTPIVPFEDAESLGLPQSLARGSSTYLLKVVGNSMADEQIRDGDYLIVDRSAAPRDGETVVARIIPENAVTVKVHYREEDQVRLQPANRNMLPMMFPAKDVEIQGVVIGLLRKY